MRRLVYDTLVDVYEATDVGDRIYQRGTLGTAGFPEIPDKPFLIYGEGTTSARFEVQGGSDAEDIPYQVYAYGEPGSLVVVTNLLRLLRSPVLALAGTTSPTGARCIGVQWGGLSQDFFDSDYDAMARFASFVLTGSHHNEGN